MTQYIVKGFIIPKRGKDNTPMYTRVFSRVDCDMLYEDYKKALQKYSELYMNIKGIERLTTVQDINDFINGLIFYIKSFTVTDIIPEELGLDTKTLPASSTSLLRSYLMFDTSYFNYDLTELVSNIEGIVKHVMNPLKEINAIINKLIWNLGILEFPADTRPGSNTSSLIIHMLTVSAIASAIYQYRNQWIMPEREDKLQMLRLVSLFHDVGKMKDWHKHESISSELLQEILNEHCEREASEIVKKASSIIVRHEEDELYKIFKRADRLASSLDRLLLLGPKLMPQGWASMERMAINKGYNINNAINDWKFWEAFTCDDIVTFTKEFCQNASRIDKDNPIFVLSDHDEKTNEIKICRLDFKGIQSFIYSNNLRVMNGASRIVDIVTNVLIPFYLVKNGLLAESILYYGGGNLTLLVPAHILDDNTSNSPIQRCVDYFSTFNINLNYGTSFLYQNFTLINHNIDKDLASKKLFSLHDESIYHNLAKLCESCNNRPVDILTKARSEQEKNMCNQCRKKFTIGNDYHFDQKIRTLLKGLETDTINRLKDYIMEYIGGHSIDEIKEGSLEEYKNIACIKIDGNILGQLMASSISITDAYERSIRIDASLKEAFHNFLSRLKRDELSEYLRRVIMGIMYMGGDDAMILVPSTIALPLSLYMINEYYLNMGAKSTLSIGIAVGKPKHPVQLLKESSEYLLDEICKEEVRRYASNVHMNANDIDFRGAIAFWSANGSSMNPNILDSIMTTIRDEALSMQPYIISNKDHESSIYKLLAILDYAINGKESRDSTEEYIDLLFKILNDRTLSLSGDALTKLKELRRDVLSTLHVSISGCSDLILRIIFSKREAESRAFTGDIRANIHKLLLTTLLRFDAKTQKNAFTLYDLYEMLKVMGVE